MAAQEYNFDGLIGPTHNFAGLSFGNVASASHQNQISNPRAAALQGLAKMKCLMEMGVPQALLPPQLRPDVTLLRNLGFTGKSPTDLINKAHRISPQLVAHCFSAANMWSANAATVSASADCADQRLHLTPANLSSTLHRSLESQPTTTILKEIFSDSSQFCIHQPLAGVVALTDEGAANHTRLCPSHESPGIEVFVYGADPLNPNSSRPQRFPARQTRLACESIARQHQLESNGMLFWQQNPTAIDAGVFHNDVISVGNQNVLLCHELAFVDQQNCLSQLRKLYAVRFESPLYIVELADRDLPMPDVVKSYLFNSQLVTRPDGKMCLICPSECDEIASARRAVNRILNEDNPVEEVKFLELRQSMNNGGGPACLRLRVVLSNAQVQSIHQPVILTTGLAERLVDWINQNYREALGPGDLLDPQLITEALVARQQLAELLKLESLQANP
jgi:succinylarginine dihydrolase